MQDFDICKVICEDSSNIKEKMIIFKTCKMNEVRKQFPFFDNEEENYQAFLDTAASSQKPKVVIDKISDCYNSSYANVHRGAYKLSAELTSAFEASRDKVAKFIGAKDSSSVIFTKGATEAFNLIASSLQGYFNKGDSILITLLEHHSNIVPWELLAKRKGLNLIFTNVNQDGTLDIEDFEEKLKKYSPKLTSVTALSNALGTLTPLKKLVSLAKAQDSLVCVDASQAALHQRFDLKETDIDFLAFSSHKLYGPNAVGVLYVKPECYQIMEPYQGGGDMIETVRVEGTTFAEPPHKFEAGTPAIVEVVALGTAIDYVNNLGFEQINKLEKEIFEYAAEKLKELEFLELYGPYFSGKDSEQTSIISFNVKGVHAHDVATIADSLNVQLRAGHHCTMPLLKHLNINSSVRMSIGVYTVKKDIDKLIEALYKVKEIFG